LHRATGHYQCKLARHCFGTMQLRPFRDRLRENLAPTFGVLAIELRSDLYSHLNWQMAATKTAAT
jgi:hypothetical protein